MPEMQMSREFEHALTLARIALRFGQVRRVTMHLNGERESDTTHTVMLTLLGIEMAPLAGCDPGLVAQFAAVHYLPETYAGDTNTARGLSPAEVEEKASREARAIERLHTDLGDSSVLALLRRYEAQQEPEARLVRYLDKVTPKLSHFLNGGIALAALGLTASDLKEKHATQGSQLACQYPELVAVRRLFDEACALVEANVLDQLRPGMGGAKVQATDDDAQAELAETRLVLEEMQGRTPDLPRSTVQLAREVVAQGERWRIDAEHYRSEASAAMELRQEVARRLALVGRLAALTMLLGAGVRTPFWPHMLRWSDDQVAQVERWLIDSTVEMPEVLRG